MRAMIVARALVFTVPVADTQERLEQRPVKRLPGAQPLAHLLEASIGVFEILRLVQSRWTGARVAVERGPQPQPGEVVGLADSSADLRQVRRVFLAGLGVGRRLLFFLVAKGRMQAINSRIDDGPRQVVAFHVEEQTRRVGLGG